MWDAGHQTLKKKAKEKEKRNMVNDHLPAVQIVEHTTKKKDGRKPKSRAWSRDPYSLVHVLMIEDTGIGLAVALLRALKENEVEVIQGVKGSLIELRGLGLKAEQGPEGQDLIHVPIAKAVNIPVTDEPIAGPGIEIDIKVEIKRNKKRIKVRTRNYTSNVGKGNIKAGLEHLTTAE